MILAILSLLKTPIVHKTAYQIVQGVSIASYSSFVCLSAYCLSYSLDVARYAFKNKTGNMLNNQTKSVQALMADLG